MYMNQYNKRTLTDATTSVRVRKENTMNDSIHVDDSQNQVVKQLESMNYSTGEILSASNQVNLARENMKRFERIRNSGKMNFIAEATKFFRPMSTVVAR